MKAITVLLVEDDPALAAATTSLLEAHSYAVHWSSSIESASRQLELEHCCDIVLLDLDLGRERGEMLIDRQRISGMPVPPIVIVSGQPESECREATSYTDAVAIVRKPYRAEELLGTIRRVLSGSGALRS